MDQLDRPGKHSVKTVVERVLYRQRAGKGAEDVPILSLVLGNYWPVIAP